MTNNLPTNNIHAAAAVAAANNFPFHTEELGAEGLYVLYYHTNLGTVVEWCDRRTASSTFRWGAPEGWA